MSGDSPTPPPRRLQPILKSRSFSFQMLTQTPDKAPLPQAMYSEALHPLRLPPSYDHNAAPSYAHDSTNRSPVSKPNQYAVAAAAAAVQSARQQQEAANRVNGQSMAGRRSESSLGFYRSAPEATRVGRRQSSVSPQGTMRSGRGGRNVMAGQARRQAPDGKRAVTLPLASNRTTEPSPPLRSEFEFEFAETIPLDLASTIAVPDVAPLSGEAEEAPRRPKTGRRRLSISWFRRSSNAV
jgi:hypothetical protein